MTDTRVKMIGDMKPALRRDEVVRQANLASTDTELDVNVVELTWRPSAFEPFRTQQFRYHGISDPLDNNGRVAVQLSKPGDPDVKMLTLGLHMVGRISPVTDDQR
jgi:hypothetical protein